jgi:hypothetical protein
MEPANIFPGDMLWKNFGITRNGKVVFYDYDEIEYLDPIVIVSAARTPMGSFQGDFSPLAAHDLGGAAIKAAVERAGIRPSSSPKCCSATA